MMRAARISSAWLDSTLSSSERLTLYEVSLTCVMPSRLFFAQATRARGLGGWRGHGLAHGFGGRRCTGGGRRREHGNLTWTRPWAAAIRN